MFALIDIMIILIAMSLITLFQSLRCEVVILIVQRCELVAKLLASHELIEVAHVDIAKLIGHVTQVGH